MAADFHLEQIIVPPRLAPGGIAGDVVTIVTPPTTDDDGVATVVVTNAAVTMP